MIKTRRRGCGPPRHHTIRALALRCSLLKSAVDLLHCWTHRTPDHAQAHGHWHRVLPSSRRRHEQPAERQFTPALSTKVTIKSRSDIRPAVFSTVPRISSRHSRPVRIVPRPMRKPPKALCMNGRALNEKAIEVPLSAPSPLFSNVPRISSRHSTPSKNRPCLGGSARRTKYARERTFH